MNPHLYTVLITSNASGLKKRVTVVGGDMTDDKMLGDDAFIAKVLAQGNINTSLKSFKRDNYTITISHRKLIQAL